VHSSGSVHRPDGAVLHVDVEANANRATVNFCQKAENAAARVNVLEAVTSDGDLLGLTGDAVDGRQVVRQVVPLGEVADLVQLLVAGTDDGFGSHERHDSSSPFVFLLVSRIFMTRGQRLVTS